jgi:hypothetical protein
MSATCGAASLKPRSDPGDRPAIVSPATALWNQRETIADLRGRFEALGAAVGRLSDLTLFQWAGIAAFALEFRPDLIIELGRGRGNSTCCFTEVANRLGGASSCRVVSLCLSADWFNGTLARVEKIVPPEWFAPTDVRVCDILACDIPVLIKGAKRPLIFWDAHGFEVAEWVLGKLLPQVADKPHRVLMHDMCDTRYEMAVPEYGEMGLWKGTNADDPSFVIGHVFSRVAQAISIVDFTTRNRLPLHSAAESLHDEIASDTARQAELKQLLGDELFSLRAYWYWFTLNGAPGPVSFPRYTLHGKTGTQSASQTQARANQIQSHLSSEASPLSMEDIDFLANALRDNQRLETLWRDVERSAGWKMLNAWRTVRDHAMPANTWRRKMYDLILGPLR